MDKFIKSVVLILLSLVSSISMKAYNSDDVFFFVVPKGYTVSTLSNTLSVSTDVLYKYNPKLNNGLTAGMQLYLPATAVSEEKLKKVDAAPTFAGGALNSVYSHALNEYATSAHDQKDLDHHYENKSATYTQPQKGQTNKSVKQTVEGYFFNRGFKNPITKVILHLEDDYIVKYEKNGVPIACEKKHKIYKNPNANPSKIRGEYSLLNDIAVHSYLDYRANWANTIVYFNLKKGIELSPEPQDNNVYTKDDVDKDAEYPGGLTALSRFISQNMKYPEDAYKNNIQGKVVLRLLIEQDGSISEITVIKSVHQLLDNEALRVAKKLPKFKPAVKNGFPVRYYLVLPMTFGLAN